MFGDKEIFEDFVANCFVHLLVQLIRWDPLPYNVL